MDGGTLTAALHERGVNVRYLGTLLKELDKVEDTGRLDHIQVSATAVPTIHSSLLQIKDLISKVLAPWLKLFLIVFFVIWNTNNFLIEN